MWVWNDLYNWESGEEWWVAVDIVVDQREEARWDTGLHLNIINIKRRGDEIRLISEQSKSVERNTGEK